MVAAFAEENQLATIVGTKTAGRLLTGTGFKVGHGYFLGLPIGNYLTWQGRMIEGSGISPAVPIELDFDALMAGGETQDNQMKKALEDSWPRFPAATTFELRCPARKRLELVK